MKYPLIVGFMSLTLTSSVWAQNNSEIFAPGQVLKCIDTISGGKKATIHILLQAQLDDPEACGGYCNPFVPFEFHRYITTKSLGSPSRIEFSVVRGPRGQAWNGRHDEIFATVSPYPGPRTRNGKIISFVEARKGFVLGTLENGIPCQLYLESTN